jgi:hypothetical protein
MVLCLSRSIRSALRAWPSWQALILSLWLGNHRRLAVARMHPVRAHSLSPSSSPASGWAWARAPLQTPEQPRRQGHHAVVRHRASGDYRHSWLRQEHRIGLISSRCLRSNYTKFISQNHNYLISCIGSLPLWTKEVHPLSFLREPRFSLRGENMKKNTELPSESTKLFAISILSRVGFVRMVFRR